MPISEYLRDVRRLVGHRLLLLPAVAAVIRDDRGRILLMQSSETGQWSLPAGGIEPGETPAEAVAREVAEEPGLRVKFTQLAAAVGGTGFRTRYPNGDKVEYVVTVFDCEVEPGDLTAVDGEAAAFQWAPPDAVPGLLDLPYPPELFARPR